MIPEITVLIPSYNHVQYVEQTIRSVLEQKDVSFEVIVIDDASADGSRELLERLSHELGFTFIAREKNRGVNANLVEGLQLSRGKWISMIASDDCFLPGKLRRQLTSVEENGWDGVYASGMVLTESGHLNKMNLAKFEEEYRRGTAAEAIFTRDYGLPLMQSGLFSRQLLLDTIHIRERYKSDDWAFSVEAFKGYRIGYLDEPAFVYRLHSDNSYRKYWYTLPMRVDVISTLIPDQYRDRALASVLSSHGTHLMADGHGARGWRYVISAQFLNPDRNQLVNAAKSWVVARRRGSATPPMRAQQPPRLTSDQWPCVSVMIVTYNQKEFVEETVRSAADQDYENLQVVVADDGSTDGTAEILRQLAAEYGPRLKVITGGPNLGITGNTNRGLAACEGELIAFQGGDDVLLPGKIRAQAAFMQANPDCPLSYHEVEVFDTYTGRTLYYFSEGQTFEGGADVVIDHGTFFCATSVMARRACMPAEGASSEISVASDWLMWIRTLQGCGGQIRWMPGVYARYRRHDRNVTRRQSRTDYSENLKTLALLESDSTLQRSLIRKQAELAVLSAAQELRDAQPLRAVRELVKASPTQLLPALLRVVRRKRLLERKRARHGAQ